MTRDTQTRAPRGKDITRLVLVAGIATAFMTVLSVPLSPSIPILGNLLNPYGGVWNIDHQTPVKMDVSLPFLQGEVTVIKDEYGVPHIYAEYECDAAAVLGYLHGRDRLFQLEMTRRQISGLLSEAVGNGTLATDMKFRNLRLKSAGENLSKWYETYDPVLYPMVTNYTAGLNYFIDTTPTLPMEFHLVGIEPGHWGPADVCAIEKYMDYDLTFNTGDLSRWLLRQALEQEGYATAMDELYPLRTPFQKPITVDYDSYDDERTISPFGAGSDPATTAVEAIISWLDQEDPFSVLSPFEGTGSNNWVVNGTKSATGAPILCNDMHLSWSLPNIWYEVQMVANDTGLNCHGFSIPGTPFPTVGHNEHVAWGMTNVGADSIDWYRYNQNGTHYLYNGSWYPFTSVVEEIPVKGLPAVQFEIQGTRHGPVLEYTTPTGLQGDTIAFRWAAIDDWNHTTTLSAIYGFNHARNLTEFKEALRLFSLPTQNIVHADRYGNIAIRCSGYVPVRAGITTTDMDCRFLLNGSAGEHEWVKYIDFEDWPHSENPAQGYLASANQMSSGPNYTYYYQHSMDIGYRGRRINDLLANDDSVTVEDMIAIQNDVYDKSAEWLVPLILDVYNDPVLFTSGEKTATIVQAMEQVAQWNASSDKYKMLKTLAAPTIYAAILDTYMKGIFKDEFANITGQPWFGYPAASLIENMSLNDPASAWFDNVTTTGTVETRDDIIKSAIISGIAYLASASQLSGKAPAEWLYGDSHTIYFAHLAGLQPLSAGPYPASGSGITPNPSYAPLFKSAGGGASERMIIDFSGASTSFNTSLIVIPGGSSGDPASPHYTDQLDLFLAGDYHSLYYYGTIASFPAGEREATWTFKGAS